MLAFEYVYVGFSCVYVLDIAVLLCVQPWQLYFHTDAHSGRLLDLVITVVVAIASLLWIIPSIHVPDDTVKFFNMIRVLKIFPLAAAASDEFSQLVHILFSTCVGSLNVIAQLFLWTSLWVTLGGQLYGGLVYAENPALADTDYLKSYYQVRAPRAPPPPRAAADPDGTQRRRPAPPQHARGPLSCARPSSPPNPTPRAPRQVLNFNDHAHGFLPFFYTLAAAGPDPTLIGGFEAVSGNVALARAFFLSYYYTTQLLVLNVFISFIISTYTLKRDLAKTKATEHERDEQLRSLYATIPEEEGWVVKAKANEENADMQLRSLFAAEVREAVDMARREAAPDAAPPQQPEDEQRPS